MENYKIGFIGFGNMAQALADGLLLKKAVAPQDLYACAKDYEKLRQNCAQRGINPCRDAQEVAQETDMVIIAVKPHLVAEVLSPIREVLLPGTRHLSTIPNTPVSVGEGIIVCERRHSLSGEDYRHFERIFSQVGLVQPVETLQLGVAGTVSGCGPAFASMFLEALADAGVKHGLPRALSYRLASQMIVGTGALQLQSGAHPGAMKDAVCSPGGTTIKGVAALERGGLRAAVLDAIDAIEGK